ncbi:MAG TPA: CocE/NonD family hydrolase, partial [Pyrinomonadaceae bacterium]|nr:CocE/NonD family hydrolase [Pyrinomonadaceae bacterium]
MHKKTVWTAALVAVAFALVLQIPANQTVYSQGGRERPSPEDISKRIATENELQSIAIVERKLMIPMRDGTRIATDVYRPKDTSKKYPTIFVRTPYNFNYWDVRNGAPRELTNELEAVKRGYAFVEMNER